MPTIRLPAPDAPVASVIVLAFRRSDSLARCLASLADHRSAVPFEVVVVVNGATPQVRAFVDTSVEGGVIVPTRVNLGFSGGCNRGVAASRGGLLVLLNDDATVEDGWLDALVAAAETRPKAGVVGSLVLFPDGVVQDTGGRLGEDGMPSVEGRGSARTSAIATAPRPIDYASGCAVLVRREAWEAVGGLDERFYPAYFEDVDLCLRLQAVGWEAWFEPGAVVRHEESASTDPMLRSVAWDWNKERFLARWGPDGRPPEVHVGTTEIDLLETEIEFFERAAAVQEERLTRTARLLDDARFNLSRLKADHVGALEVLDRERAHGAWLGARLEDQRARAEAAEAHLGEVVSGPYRWVVRAQAFVGRHRSVRALVRPLRRLARR
jgi:GT2 family glycosyltransferase